MKEAARARRRILTDGDAYAARGAREGSAPAWAGRNAAATRLTTSVIAARPFDAERASRADPLRPLFE